MTQIKNLLDMQMEVEINTLASLEKQKIGHSACAFKNLAFYIIGGMTKTLSVGDSQVSVYCF